MSIFVSPLWQGFNNDSSARDTTTHAMPFSESHSPFRSKCFNAKKNPSEAHIKLCKLYPSDVLTNILDSLLNKKCFDFFLGWHGHNAKVIDETYL